MRADDATLMPLMLMLRQPLPPRADAAFFLHCHFALMLMRKDALMLLLMRFHFDAALLLSRLMPRCAAAAD